MDPYKYQVDVAVSKPLTETEKTKLMVALSDAVESVLGQSSSGCVFVHTPRTEE